MTADGKKFWFSISLTALQALMLCWLWPNLAPRLFPRVAELGIPLDISWWDSFKLLFLVSIFYKTDVSKDFKDD